MNIKIRGFFFFFIFLMLASGLKAQELPNQEPCAAAVLHERLLQTNETYRKQILANEMLLEAVKNTHNSNSRSAQTSTSTILTIPVVVHIIHLGEAVGVGNNISDAQVNSAITALNNMYRKKSGTYGDGGGVDTEVEFKLATRGPDCNLTTGIVRVNGSSVPNYATQGVKTSSVGADEIAVKNLSRWPNTDYYNIWVVNEIENNNGGAGIQGYAYFPGAPANIDGTVILNSAFGTMGTAKSYTNRGQTLAHEMGHAFNLYHTFEGDGSGSSCPPVVNGCGSGQGDCIADTEPHKRSNSNCPAGTINTCTNTTIGDVYKNYLDYSSQSCANQFTADQKVRLRDSILNLRPGLLNAQSLTAGIVQVPVTASCSPNGTVAANPYGIGIYEVVINGAAVASNGTTDENALYVDHSCNQQFSVSGNSAFPIAISTGPANKENVKIYLDYNGNGSFSDAGELAFTSNNVMTNHAGTITPLANASLNTPLGMRIISDAAAFTISGPCYVPQYGQVEEYSISFISPLPVSLVSFIAEKEGQKVNLTWKTVQEINNSYFEAERSADGLKWRPIAKIAGNGTSSFEHNYQFLDVQPLFGDNYYRLKQVDLDGKFLYSEVRFVNLKEENNGTVSVFPNPGNGDYSLTFSKIKDEFNWLSVYDLRGKLVYQSEINQENQPEFSISTQPAGLYLLEISGPGKVTNLKLIKE